MARCFVDVITHRAPAYQRLLASPLFDESLKEKPRAPLATLDFNRVADRRIAALPPKEATTPRRSDARAKAIVAVHCRCWL